MNSLRIQYVSDIHLEYYHNIEVENIVKNKIIPIAPICVLTGDIGYPFNKSYKIFLEEISKKFIHIFLIHGNHEYYQIRHKKTMDEIIEKTKEITSTLENVHFLDNSYYDLNEYRFIGTTLWSKIDDPKYTVNDCKKIEEFTVEKSNELYERNYKFIKDMLERSVVDNKKVVMITHHLPSYKLIDSKYEEYALYNQCFASNSDELIIEPVICWLFGHTHSSVDIVINNIRCVANPIGYRGENININFNKTIEI
jgi:predicted phosphohydrolase